MSISKVTRTNGSTRYVARVHAGGRHLARAFPTRREAKLWESETVSARDRGGHIDPRSGRVLLADFAHDWLDGLQVRPKTAASYRNRTQLHIIPGLGTMKVASIRRADVQRFVNGLNLAPSTARSVFAVLRLLLREAVERELIARNPCVGVKLPELVQGRRELLEAEQITALAAAMRPDLELAIWLGAGCGLRIGEVMGLRVSDVDFLRRQLHVRQQWRGEPLKTRASRRTIPVDDLVLQKISQHISSSDFTTRSGLLLGGVSQTSFSEAWRAAVKAAGLPAGTRFHQLRHWYGSVLVRSGMSVKVVQARMGHASAMVTLDVYAALWPSDAEVGRGVVESAFASPETVTARW